MSSYSTNEFRSGLKIILDGDPYTIVENEFVKPGKGQAFNRVRIRNLKSGRTLERSFRSGETVEAADVVETDMQYLYNDGDFWHFMVPDTFEQHTAGKDAMGETAMWLKDGTTCKVMLWNGVPLGIDPPAHVELKIVETDPGPARRYRHRRPEVRRSSRLVPSCVCRCSSTRARSSASTRGPASTCRAPRADARAQIRFIRRPMSGRRSRGRRKYVHVGSARDVLSARRPGRLPMVHAAAVGERAEAR